MLLTYSPDYKYVVWFVSQMPSQTVVNFLLKMEAGYSLHGNPYHNGNHSADVAQTTYNIVWKSGFAVSTTESTFVVWQPHIRQSTAFFGTWNI